MTSSSVFGGTVLTYDPLGRLWSLSSPAWGKTQFVYDRGQVAVEYDGDTGGVRRRCFWGLGVDETVLQDEGGAMNCTGTKVLHGDERGSIGGVADCNGNRTNANTYDDYGSGASGNWGRYQYTGQAWLQELGLYTYKNRMYSARLGRFMQTDPIGYDAGMNLYGYVGGDPVNKVDPLGLDEVFVTAPRWPTSPSLGGGNLDGGLDENAARCGGGFYANVSFITCNAAVQNGPAKSLPGAMLQSLQPIRCVGTVRFSAIGPRQALGNSALYLNEKP